MDNKASPPAGGSQQPADGKGAASAPAADKPAAKGKAPAATPAAPSPQMVKAKAFYDKLFPPESPQRKWGPFLIVVAALTVLLLVKCTVTTATDKIAAVSQAHAEAVKVRTTGVLLVKSNRPEAEIEATRIASADDKSTDTVKGALGQALPGLTPGKYAVKVHADGWPDAHGEVDVPAGQQTETTINFASGSLHLESNPSGAIVKQGSAMLGRTPLVVPQLPPGELALSIQYPYWPALPFKTAIKVNEETTEMVRLPQGKLTVESSPAGAAVFFGKLPLGKTPLTIEQFQAGTNKLTFQAKDFPPLEVSVTMEDHGDVKINPEMGYGFPELDPAALLRSVWVPDDPNRLSPGVDSLGRYEPRNGVVKNLNRKRLYQEWLGKRYRYSATVKAYDPKTGQVEFAEQSSELSRYRVLAELPLTARNDKDLVAQLKGATLTLYGNLGAVEEPRWPFKVITFEFTSAELLH